MSRISGFSAALSICFITLTPSFAQFSVGLHGSLVSEEVKGSDAYLGGGLNAKIFLSPRFDIGVGIKAFGESQDFGGAGQNYGYTAAVIPITGMVDYYLSDGFLRPYIGAEAGIYATAYTIKLNGQETSKVNSTRFGVAPKVGLLMVLGNLGIFAEADYHILFGNKNESVNVGSANNINFDKNTKYLMLNLGIQIGIPTSK